MKYPILALSLTVSALALLVSCGGESRPKEQAPEPSPTNAREDDRPMEGIGGTIRGALKDTLGIDTTTKTAAAMVPQGRGHEAGDPIAVVVHGIAPVEGTFDPLFTYLGRRGYRVYAFKYDDSQDLDASAAELGTMLGEMIDRYPTQKVAVVAHSMGGLVSRRAHTLDHESGLTSRDAQFTLITIASPFGGFLYADGARYDMGFGHDSWQDVGTTSTFISQPGLLGPNVEHYKIETDEAGKTRLVGGEKKGDDAVSFDNQRQSDVDSQTMRTLRLDKGHVGCLIDPRLPTETRAALDQVLP